MDRRFAKLAMTHVKQLPPSFLFRWAQVLRRPKQVHKRVAADTLGDSASWLAGGLLWLLLCCSSDAVHFVPGNRYTYAFQL